MENYQTFINIMALAVSGGLGWFSKELWNAVKELKVDLAKLREELPKTYMPKNELEHIFRKIDAKLDRIEDKLDQKVDK